MTAEFWRMGATPVPSTQIDRFAREFESAGWDGFAVGEAHGLLPDPYIVLAASAMATLQAMSGGRAGFSIGRGDGAVKVLKRKPMRVAEFEAYLAAIQAYLRGDDVELDGTSTSMARVYDIDPSLRMTKPPLDIAATGPRTLEVAAKTADGVSFSVGADVERLRASAELVRETCAQVGRDPDSLQLGCYLQVAVTDADQSAREAIRGLVVTHARFSGWEPKPAVDVSEEAHTSYRHALQTMESVYRSSRGGVAVREGGRPGEVDFYPHEAGGDELIDQFAIAGPAKYCAERLQEIIELGFTRFMVGTRAVGVDLDEANALRIGREVLPLLRRQPPR